MSIIETFEVISPVDGTHYVTRHYASEEEIGKIMERARAALKPWQQTPLKERMEIVSRFTSEMSRRSSELADAVSWQMGRPLWQADETPRLSLLVEEMAKYSTNALADIPFETDTNITRYARPSATGIHLSICAWNYPTAMLGYIVASPLVAGNIVVLKHSPQTPIIAEIAAEAFKAAGGPDGVFQSIHLSHSDAERMISSECFNTINFIGSVAGGRRVHAAAAGTFTHVHLELGGKDPTYLRADADLEAAVAQIAEGCFSNSGQSCCSVERIYVADEIYKQFLEAFTAETHKWTIGNPFEGKPMIGPVVHLSAANAIRGLVNEAKRDGAKSIISDDRYKIAKDGSAYVAPNILVDVDHTMRIMKNEELFGPIACVQKVEGDAQAISLMNDSNFGLSASIWTRDIAHGVELLDQIDAGTVYLNRCDHADIYLPWGGVKESGLGRANGRIGLLSATTTKAYHVRQNPSDP